MTTFYYPQVVIEDSNIGHRAAKAAGMICVVTKSSYTADEDFSLADAIFDDLGEAGPEAVTLDSLLRMPATRP